MPTALDNGQRSPRGLLRAVTARLLGGRLRTRGIADERVALVAKLRPGLRDTAAWILSKGAPYGVRLAGFRRHNVFLVEETLVFVFEGPGIEGLVRDLVNEPTYSAAFSIWVPLLEGTPVLAREEFFWQAGRQQ